MPYKDEERDREYHREIMREKREGVTKGVTKGITVDTLARQVEDLMKLQNRLTGWWLEEGGE